MVSKFSGLLQARQPLSQPSEETLPKKDLAAPATAPVTSEAPRVPQDAQPPANTPQPISMLPPRGKKGHPDYNQVTLYLRKETHNKAKIALLQAQDDRDFSELVEDLLRKFVAGK